MGCRINCTLTQRCEGSQHENELVFYSTHPQHRLEIICVSTFTSAPFGDTDSNKFQNVPPGAPNSSSCSPVSEHGTGIPPAYFEGLSLNNFQEFMWKVAIINTAKERESRPLPSKLGLWWCQLTKRDDWAGQALVTWRQKHLHQFLALHHSPSESFSSSLTIMTHQCRCRMWALRPVSRIRIPLAEASEVSSLDAGAN